MKKALSIFLAVILALALAACGNTATADDPGQSPSGETVKPEDSSEPVADGEVYEVVIQYPTLGATPEDLQMVEDAINERIETEIGVRIKFYPVSAFDLNSTTNLMVSSGEKLDLMMSLFENGIGSYVNKGILIELDDLVDQYGADIVAAEGRAMSGAYFNGKLYAVPAEEKMGRVQGLLTRKDLLDKYEITYDANHVYTYDELTDIFATIKAGEGDKFYCIGVNGGETPPFASMAMVDYLGSSLASGCLTDYGVGTTTVVNYFETEAFATACEYAREWYQKGYFSPDCNTTTDSAVALFQTGNYLGSFNNCEPDMVANWSSMARDYFDTEVVALNTTAPSAMTQFYQISMWGIPITCENPEKTMQWLNLMYADQDIINLLYHGIEGVHWNFAEGSDTVVEFPEGIDSSNTGYLAILNVWGDKSKDYVMAPLDETYYQHLADFNDSITPEYTSGALGYCFNSDPVKTEIAAVQDVISQYQVSLGLGVVDPDTVLPEFLEALQAADIDKVIAENQRQFDEWLAAQ